MSLPDLNAPKTYKPMAAAAGRRCVYFPTYRSNLSAKLLIRKAVLAIFRRRGALVTLG